MCETGYYTSSEVKYYQIFYIFPHKFKLDFSQKWKGTIWEEKGNYQ